MPSILLHLMPFTCHVFMIVAIFFHPHLVMTRTIVCSEPAVLAPCTIGGGWSHMQVGYLLL